MEYIPLNVQTCYSFLQSAFNLEKYVYEAKKNNFKYLGICDNNPYAFAEFSKLCLENDIKPILGSKISFIFKHNIFDLYIYIKNEIGYSNFCKLYSEIKDNIYHGKIDSTEGLIAVISSFSDNILQDEELLALIKNKFHDLYVGLECYKKEHLEKMKQSINIAKQHNIKYIPFPKVKALSKHDGLILKMLEAINKGLTLESLENEDTPYFLLTNNGVSKIYDVESINNLQDFYDVDFTLIQKRGSLLSFRIDNKKEYLFNLAYNSLKEKKLDNEKYINRLNYELNVIEKMGYLDYFLIVYQYVNNAKKNKIYVGPGRGSAAGALLSYALNITEIDPLKYNLLFERFLNPDRVTMPDIDVDFADYQRDNVIKHISETYGENRVKPIITFQTFGAKQALRDVGKVFNFNVSDINLLCKVLKKSNTFSEALSESKEYRELLNNPYYNQIVSLAKKIEGFPRQKGLHAAGIIINNVPLNEVLPISNENNAPVPFEAIYLEQLGFFKMDILALKNLTLIEEIVQKINIDNPNFNLHTIPLNDQKTFDILNLGLTKSIFQLESEGITNALKLIHIDFFDDIVCLNALYRPGPMDNIKLYAKRKKGEEKITYLNPILEPILSETNGIIVYQEQIMLIAQKVASFSLAKADILRRAISKKDETKLKNLKDDFIKGALENSFSEKDAKKLYDYIYKFANYGFNKSHSVAYSLITYQLAFLKANYPIAFYSVILDYQKNTDSKYLPLLNELQYFNIKLLSPSINKSLITYSYEKDGIRLPLCEIKEINQNIEKMILEERKKGEFKDFLNFIQRMAPYKLNQIQIENLINAGAFDEFNHSRLTLKNGLNSYLLFVENFPTLDGFTQNEINDLKPNLKIYQEDISLKNNLEIECLGILLSGDLFEKYKEYIKKNNIKSIHEIYSLRNIETSIIVEVLDYREINTKRNEKMAILKCFDNYNQIKVIVFPKDFNNLPLLLKNDIIVIKGSYNVDEIGESFIANSIIKMEDL